MQLPILPDSPEPPSEGDSNDGRSDPGVPVSGELLSALLEDIHHQIRGALLYTHHRAERNTETLADLAATVQAVLAVLVEQGIIRPEELDKRRREAAVLIKKQFKDRGMGAIRLVPEIDKYDFKSNSKVDCASRLHVCRAASLTSSYPARRL